MAFFRTSQRTRESNRLTSPEALGNAREGSSRRMTVYTSSAFSV